MLQVQSSLEDLNGTMLLYVRQNDLRLRNMDSTVSNISQRMAALESNNLLHIKDDGAGSMVSVRPGASASASRGFMLSNI